MHRAAILTPILMLTLLLGACGREPDFDDRYDAAAKEIDARAKAMDADIAKAEQAANVAGAAEEQQPQRSAPLPDPANPSNRRPSSGE